MIKTYIQNQLLVYKATIKSSYQYKFFFQDLITMYNLWVVNILDFWHHLIKSVFGIAVAIVVVVWKKLFYKKYF
jgi:hypothetical protein